ncbi:flavin reductase [Streptomyces sp. NBC_00335]|uniref:flavin reductase n=1 Tax=Streptomyces sp. NBC_00086 TaxID=2903618 RepID=UPI00224F9231|nr:MULTISPECIES: flavin reductase [unclassified Streptomyces]MCX5410214.1 flavin reductase [Streptomyces sp. NBC_00086]
MGIVTTAGEDGWHGMTASSFSSVSLAPPLVLVCLDQRIRSHDLLLRNGVFAVNVLGRDHLALGRRFAGMEPGVTDRFASGDWLPGATGSPVLTDSAAWVDCRVLHRYPGGDHTIFLGEVVAAGVPRITSPLLFHSRSWGQLADPLPDRVDLADSGLTDSGLTGSGLAGAAAGPRDARLTQVLRRAGIRVRLGHLGGERGQGAAAEGGGDGLGCTSVHVADAAAAVRAAAAGSPAVELTITADGHGTAAADTVRAIRGAGHPDTLVVARVRDALQPGLARACLLTVQRLAAAGCGEIVLEEPAEGCHDTDGASPLELRRLLQDAIPEAGPVPLRLALRDHHGLGLVNALTGMKSGVRCFDTHFGGHGGLLSTERLVLLCSRMNVAAPLDIAALRALRGGPGVLRRQQRPAPVPHSPAQTVSSRVPESQ